MGHNIFIGFCEIKKNENPFQMNSFICNIIAN
jgi:hypothetical protein